MAENKNKGGESSTEKKKMNPAYALTNNDNPGNLITHVQLTERNYDEWSRAVENGLTAKKKLGFINGVLKIPDAEAESPSVDDWIAVNAMIKAWIMNTIEPILRSTVSHASTAKELWDEIRERFHVTNGPRVQQLRGDLAKLMQKGMTIMVYYGKMKQLWDELADHDPIPACRCKGCTCGGCSCNLGGEFVRKREVERLHQFLLGLDDDVYGTVRSTILSMEPLPTVSRAYSKICQEERLHLISKEQHGRTETAMGFAAQVSGGGGCRSEKGECSCCGRSGHEPTSCFQLIGYPDWWGTRSKFGDRGGKTGGGGRSRGSGGPGRGRGFGPASAAVRANSAQFVGSVSGNAGGEPGSSALSGITPEHVQSLMTFLKDFKPTVSEKLTGTKLLNWIIDSGASRHMTGVVECFKFLKSIVDCFVYLPDGGTTVTKTEGNIDFGSGIESKRVLYVPDLNCNLMSVSQLVDEMACDVLFTKTGCVMQDPSTRMEIGRLGDRREGLYYLNPASSVRANSLKIEVGCATWHRRLGHPSSKIIGSLFPGSGRLENKLCDACMKAKQTRNVFPESINKAAGVFDLIHCDIWGPYRVPSSCGASYFLTIVDDYSRSVWIFLLTAKSEVGRVFKNFVSMIKRQFDKDIKIVRSDNGSEFTCLRDYFASQGIMHQTSCVSTPQQNGRVERKHRHILNIARALRFQANLPIDFWGECVLTAGYLINRTPSDVLGGKSPFECLFGVKPDYTHLKVFGCLCYAKDLNRTKDKFASRSRQCIFVGYPFGKKGWRVFDLETREYFVSRDVYFSEEEFPYAETSLSDSPDIGAGTSPDSVDAGSNGNQDNVESDAAVVDDDLAPPILSPSSSPMLQSRGGELEPSADAVESSAATDAVEPLDSVSPDGGDTEQQLGRGMRARTQSTRLKDFVVGAVRCDQQQPHALSFNQYSLSHYINYDRFSSSHRAFLAAVTAGLEPRSFREAVQDPLWRQAMQDEIQALENNATWTVEILPPGKKAIGSKWVYKVKYMADGTVERYKARLVVLGNNQTEGIDFYETFAPVAKMVTVRMFLSVAVMKGWELHQMDVHNAFLHGDLDEEVYMKLPPGYSTSLPGRVCRLRKSLYGLRQAPRCWFAKLGGALRSFGFRQSQADYSLFVLIKGASQLYVLIYVDDLIVGGNDSSLIARFKKYLNTCFHMKDLGSLKYFLGIEVARSSEGLFLCQRKYALDIVTEAGLLGARPSSIPMEQNHQLALAESPPLADPSKYRRLVGRLIYLTITRPELCYGVHVLAQFMQRPLVVHWDAALRVVRYLKGRPGQGILLRPGSDFRIRAYCDSDWASCPLTRRSLSGYYVMLGGSPISWKTKKQAVVSRSSAEAEYRSMAITVCELKWLRALLRCFGILHSDPMQLYCDSQSALHIAANPVFHERTKHIEIDCHFVRDEIQKGAIETHYVRSADQLADLFTKALGTTQFDFLLRKMGIRDLHAPS